MKIRQILGWIVGYEAVSWTLIAMILASPRDPADPTPAPSRGQIILMTHLYSVIFVAIVVGLYFVLVKSWKASNHRRR